MYNSRSTALQYTKIKASYQRYLATYRQLNKGSTEGALNFFEFYNYLNFTCRYSDPRACIPIGYR
ncbi:MAG: hypothetical protein RI953_1934 [Pseudomonadota bacterium]|jgi:hypothetical protein